MPLTLTDARAIIGLQSNIAPKYTNTNGSVLLASNKFTEFENSNIIYSLQAVFGASPGSFTLNQYTGVATGGNTWGAGTAQVEKVNATGNVANAGTISVTITSADLTGSPKVISVLVATGDTPSIWGGKVRTELSNDEDIAGIFSVSGENEVIELTRKPVKTYATSGGSVNIYKANDATLNIAIAANSTGVTNVGTSINLTAGVATSGTQIFDGDGKDIEGDTIGTLASIQATLFESDNCGITYDNGTDLLQQFNAGGGVLSVFPNSAASITFSPDNFGFLKITTIGTI